MSAADRLIPIALPIATKLLELGVKALRGGPDPSPEDVARELVDVALQLMPFDELKLYLTETAKQRAEIAGDLAELHKFGDEDDE